MREPRIQHSCVAVLLGCLACLLAACAEGPPALTVQQKKELVESTIPVCDGPADCKAKWEAAQIWVIHHAGWNVQTVTEVLIETFNPAPNSPLLAARVTKEPLGGGRYKFMIHVWCDNMFGCHRDTWSAELDFNQTINSVAP